MSVTNSAQDLQNIAKAAEVATSILAEMRDAIAPGVTTIEIDRLAESLLEKYGAKAAFKGVVQTAGPYQNSICISINDEVLHGIPGSRKIVEGDVLKLDFGIVYEGYYTDQCITVGVGEISKQDQRLINIGKMAVLAGVQQARVGNKSGDIGHAIQTVVELAGFNVIKDFIGHGIGKELHMLPNLYAYGKPGTGEVLERGSVVCVEAQVVAGSDEIYIEDDGWTVKTDDGENGVMFEYMVQIDDEPKILTNTQDWPIFV